MSDDKMAQNAGKTFTDTAGVVGKDSGKGGVAGKVPSPELTEEEAAAMKAKAVAAAAAKGG